MSRGRYNSSIFAVGKVRPEQLPPPNHPLGAGRKYRPVLGLGQGGHYEASKRPTGSMQ